MKAVFILTGIAVLVVGAIVLTTTTKTEIKSDDDLTRLSAVALTDYDGTSVSLEKFLGRPLVINSWAVWCPFCRKELPDFAALQKEFPQITIIAIDRNEPLATVKGYTDELGITDSMVFLLDSGDDFYRSIGGFSMPETIFVDRNSTIVFHKRGPLTLEEMRAAVTQYLPSP